MSEHRVGVAGTIERIFVVTALFLMTGAVIPLLTSDPELRNFDHREGNGLVRAITAAIYVAIGLVLAGNVQRVWSAFYRHKLLVLLLGFVLASTAWSEDAEVSLRRWLALMGATVFGIYVTVRFESKDYLRLLSLSLALAAIGSVFFAVLFPQLGVHASTDHAGLWRGVYYNKNVLGAWMSLGVVVFLRLALERGGQRPMYGLAFVLCASVLLASGSKTAIAISVLLILAIPLTMAVRSRAVMIASVLLCMSFVLVVLTFAMTDSSHIAGIRVAGSADLTGRIPLWQEAARHGLKQPWFGYGYRAFWLGSRSPADSVAASQGWIPASGHSSYLDLWLELGFVGALFYAATLGSVARNLAPQLANRPSLVTSCFALVILHQLGEGLTEIVILTPNSTMWVNYVAVMLYAARPAEQAEMEFAESAECELVDSCEAMAEE